MEKVKNDSEFNVKLIEMAGFNASVRALRLPYGLDNRSNCWFDENHDVNEENGMGYLSCSSACSICDKDLNLMSSLVKNGDEHSKVMRGIMVWFEMKAPIWFYREMETYRIGRERLACNSTMHQQCKGLSGEELEKAKDEIPMGLYQKSIDVVSYQTLRRIWSQRHNHRLPMWREFCAWIEGLPFAEELILSGINKMKRNEQVI